jgi:membrane-associated phospholipid phosphatase
VLDPGGGRRVLTAVVGVLAVLAVAFSRVYLGVHWTTDAMVSIVFVGAWLTAVVLVCRPALAAAGRPIP